jgi:ribosomal protein S18 acetylase RimI-like enzyme
VTTSGHPPGLPVLATYFHLPTRSHFRPACTNDTSVTLIESKFPLVSFYRFLYASVGSGYWWVDRLRWSDNELKAHLEGPDVTILVLYVDGTPAGYAELDSSSSEPGTEIRYMGIFPEFHGRGFGKHLLSCAVEHAFTDGATRVWLSTRSTDGPHAIRNYQGRGFVAYRTEWEPAPVHPDRAG